MKTSRVLVYVGLAVLSVAALALLVFLKEWVALVPEAFRWHTAVLVSGLSLGVYLWLRKPPAFLRSRPVRRKGRLRDRYRPVDDDETDE